MNDRAPYVDRLETLAQREDSQYQQQTLDHIAHYQALGMGLAAMCQTMYGALKAWHVALTHEEVLSLLRAAVQGR